MPGGSSRVAASGGSGGGVQRGARTRSCVLGGARVRGFVGYDGSGGEKRPRRVCGGVGGYELRRGARRCGAARTGDRGVGGGGGTPRGEGAVGWAAEVGLAEVDECEAGVEERRARGLVVNSYEAVHGRRAAGGGGRRRRRQWRR